MLQDEFHSLSLLKKKGGGIFKEIKDMIRRSKKTQF